MFFAYDERQTEYLKSRDAKLGAVIDRLDLPDIVYIIFLAVTFIAAVVIGLYIFLKDKKVNKI